VIVAKIASTSCIFATPVAIILANIQASQNTSFNRRTIGLFSLAPR